MFDISFETRMASCIGLAFDFDDLYFTLAEISTLLKFRFFGKCSLLCDIYEIEAFSCRMIATAPSVITSQSHTFFH